MLPEVKDSKWRAIFFINLFALTITLQAAIFKHLNRKGVSIIEYIFVRNIWIGGVAGIQAYFKKMNPFRRFPTHLMKDLIARSFAGQITLALLNVTVTLLPMGTAMILIQSNPFWMSILACLMLNERIRPIEIGGIIVCFVGVLLIAYSKSEEEEEEVKEGEEESSGIDKYLGLIVGFITAWTFALTSVLNRRLK